MSNVTINPRVIRIYSIVYRCESVTQKGKFYTVIVKDDVVSSCNCPAFQYGKKLICSHMYRVMESIDLENFIDATKKKEKLTSVGSWRDDQYSY